MHVRRFRPGDEVELLRVFRTSVHTIAAREYTRAELDAWAPASVDEQEWSERMRRLDPFVVVDGDRLVGFADLQGDGHIDHFYVAGDRAGGGVGRLLMARIHEEAIALGLDRLYAEVSHTARPFFERFGFVVLERGTVKTGRITLTNWKMEKHCTSAGSR